LRFMFIQRNLQSHWLNAIPVSLGVSVGRVELAKRDGESGSRLPPGYTSTAR